MNVFEAYSPVIKEGLDNLVLLLQQSGTAKMLKDIASGLIAITEGLINGFKNHPFAPSFLREDITDLAVVAAPSLSSYTISPEGAIT